MELQQLKDLGPLAFAHGFFFWQYNLHLMSMLCRWVQDRPVGSSDTTNTATATINIFIEQTDTKPPWFLPCTFIDTDKRICISSPYTGRVNISEMSVSKHDQTVPLMLFSNYTRML